MARKNPDEAEPPFGTPVLDIVDIDEAEQQVANPVAAENGRRFSFGHVGLLKFPDNTQYHINKHHALITDPVLIKNLLKASENPSNYIFPQ